VAKDPVMPVFLVDADGKKHFGGNADVPWRAIA
jgi:hypothetical protein